MPIVAFSPPEFIPPASLRNKHIQTLAGTLRHNPHISYRRQRLELPDGDFVDLDFPQTQTPVPDFAPIVLLLHGLEGDARRGYAAHLYEHLARAGLRAVGLNFRSCSGEMNRTARLYHMGATEDVAFVHDWLDAQFPEVPKGLAGISLGGNVTLKYLGEGGAALNKRLFGAVAISPPFVMTGAQALEQFPNRFYARYLLRKLKRKVRLKAHRIRQGGGDVYQALKARTLAQFDEAITAPLHGFASAQDYYARSSSWQYLPGITVPTLIIRAQDDPFFNSDIPYQTIADNPGLTGLFPAWGGHVGFISELPPRLDDDWLAITVAHYLATAEFQASTGLSAVQR